MVQQGTDEWLELRRSKVTGTDAAVLMGVDPYGMTPLKLWQRKKGLIPEAFVNDAMRRGQQLEPVALKWFCEQTKLDMVPTIEFHAEHPDLMVSLDGSTFDMTDAVEIKTGNAKTKELAARQKVPDNHYAQLQHQMLVTGLQKMWYCFYDETVVWTGLGETKKVDAYYFTVGRDEDYIKELLSKELEFAEYLKGDLPPPLDESDHLVVVADQFLMPTIQKWIEVSDEIKELKSYEKILKDAIVAQGDDSNLLFTDEIGTPLIKLSRAGRMGNVDYKALLKDKGITEEELEKYRKPQIGWYTVERA